MIFNVYFLQIKLINVKFGFGISLTSQFCQRSLRVRLGAPNENLSDYWSRILFSL